MITDRESARLRRALGSTLALGLMLGSLACQPDLGAPSSQVTDLRVLDIRATPAEAAPGTSVHYDALVVDGAGAIASAPIDWAFCNEEKPLSDLDDVDEGCFTLDSEPYLVEIGTGPSATGSLPQMGCSLFGPDVPPAMGMNPPGRPTDPDLTGGYYQPVRLILGSDGTYVLAAEESRILCDLPAATPDVAAQFRMTYVANENPVLAGLSAVVDGVEHPIGAGGSAQRGGTFTLRASWPACPSTSGCGAEPYVYYDPSTQALTTREEQITVSWFATGGSFATDDTAPNVAGSATASDNTWTAPADASSVTLWIVIRDDRGGSSWASYQLALD